MSFLAVNTLDFLPNNAFAAENCAVKTSYGTFNGFIGKNGVKTWLGIPFAKPPVGNLRWSAPQPLKPSDKTFDAKKFGFKEIQISDPIADASEIPQSEDCLTINMPKNPLQALKNGAARGIKFLTGNTADEWRCFLMADEKLFEHFSAEPEKSSPIFSSYKKQTKGAFFIEHD